MNNLYHFLKQIYCVWQLSKIHSVLWLKDKINKQDLFSSFKKMLLILPYMNKFIDNKLFEVFFYSNLAKLVFLSGEYDQAIKLVEYAKSKRDKLTSDLSSLNIAKSITYFLSLLTLQLANTKMIMVMENNPANPEITKSALAIQNQINNFYLAAKSDVFLRNADGKKLFRYLLSEKIKMEFYLTGSLKIDNDFLFFVSMFDNKKEFIDFNLNTYLPTELQKTPDIQFHKFISNFSF